MHYDVSNAGTYKNRGLEMTQLTVRDVDQRLDETLKQEAETRGMSVNRLILQLLRESVGLSSSKQSPVFTDLDPLAGTWTESDAAEFEQSLSTQRPIDDELWK
jgi:hypothetical protein